MCTRVDVDAEIFSAGNAWVLMFARSFFGMGCPRCLE